MANRTESGARTGPIQRETVMPATLPKEAPGLIQADCLYTLDEIKQRLRLGQHALRSARRDGLRVRRIGRRGYVLGRELIQYVESVGQ